MTRREQLYPEIRRLREDEGLKWREIGERLGISLKTAQDYYSDPTGERAEARKSRNNGICVDCGCPTKNSGARIPPERCRACGNKHNGELQKVWTREAILDAIREWATIHGEPPRSLDWNPTAARHVGRRVHPDYTAEPGRWPHKFTVMHTFGQPGGWARAIREAGFVQRRRGETDNTVAFPGRMAAAVSLVESGMTQVDVARRLGLNPSTVWRYVSLTRERSAA